MKTLLWVDDLRNPFLNVEGKVPADYEIFWVVNFDQFVNHIENIGMPDVISFDHDLGEEKSGYDCLKYLVELCLDTKNSLPEIMVHSANPVGADNIRHLAKNFKLFVR